MVSGKRECWLSGATLNLFLKNIADKMFTSAWHICHQRWQILGHLSIDLGHW